jgi:tRNA modification GTPase
VSSVDTIFALSTAPGRAAIAVVRVSGPSAGAVLDRFGLGGCAPRRALLRAIRYDGETIDGALVLWFPGPGSATGEDLLELQLHGAPAVIRRVLDVLARFPGCRPAEPGEFTRRAFLAGKMDLVQVEGLDDLLAAETEQQRRYAIRALTGEHRERMQRWRNDLLEARALLEAMIDFSDEGDAPDETRSDVLGLARRVENEIAALLASSGSSELLRDGVRIVISGSPNVGKSSLFNALLGRAAAIVTPEPGTTRDILEARLDLGGIPVTLMDTAGLRQTDSVVEREGVRRAREMADAADVVVHLTAPDVPDIGAVAPDDRTIRVRSKADMAGSGPAGLAISIVTGVGLDSLQERLRVAAHEVLFARGEPAAMLRARQRAALEDAQQALARLRGASPEVGAELLAEDLRRASDAIGRVTGAIDVEEVLGAIFARFCIGK